MGGRPRHATAWVALLLAAAVAGCSDGGEPAEPLPVASAELREHVLIESYGAVDYALPDDEGLVADALEAWGMEQNPGLADPDLFEAAGLRSALAFGSILARTSDADAQVRSVALEFNRTREAKAWLEAAADLDPLTHFLLHDGRFVTVLTFSESAFLPHLAEAAGYLADFLEKGLECRPGAWPPDGTRGPETGVGSPTIGPHMLLQGRLAGLGEEDWFTVEAVEPAILAVDLLGADQPAPLLDLYDAEGARLAAGVVRPLPGLQAGLAEAVEPGAYRVRVLSPEPCVSGQAFAVSFDPVATADDGNGDPSVATPFPLGHNGTFAIFPGSEEDWYNVTLDAPTELAVTVGEARGELGGGTRIWLYDHEFRELDSHTSPDPGRLQGRMVDELPPGTYYLRLIALGEKPVYHYSLQVEALGAA